MTFPSGLINKPFLIDKALILLPILFKYPSLFPISISNAAIVPVTLMFFTNDNVLIFFRWDKCFSSKERYLIGSFSNKSRLALAAAHPKGFAVKL